MRALVRCGGGLTGLLLAASVSLGQHWIHPVTRAPILPAPDACGPGWYAPGPQGMVYGPNYYLVTPWAPHNGFRPGCPPSGGGGNGNMPQCPNAMGMPGMPPGMLPQPGQAGQAMQQNAYPTHPFVRGPRDFFMWNEMLEEQQGRDIRPNIVP